jgi:hypothetical protein
MLRGVEEGMVVGFKSNEYEKKKETKTETKNDKREVIQL